MSNAIRTFFFAVLVVGVGYGTFLYFLRPAQFRRLRGRLMLLGYIYVASVLVGAFMQFMGWR